MGFEALQLLCPRPLRAQQNCRREFGVASAMYRTDLPLALFTILSAVRPPLGHLFCWGNAPQFGFEPLHPKVVTLVDYLLNGFLLKLYHSIHLLRIFGPSEI